MGTCVSKCYPTSTAGSASPAAKPAASGNAVAVHPLPLRLPGPSAPLQSQSQTTYSSMVTASSSSAMAISTSSSSSMAATSSSSSCSSMATTSSSSASSLPRLLSRDSLLAESEWDVVVLDPSKKKPPMRPHHTARRGPATSKRARPVSPLATRPPPSSNHTKKTVVRSTEPQANAQAQKRKKVAALDVDQRRRRHPVPPPRPLPQVRRTSRVPEDDLTNPLISMDCFIFL